MDAIITINMDNAAFHHRPDLPGWELSRILRLLADNVQEWELEAGSGWPLFDWNGNTVGRFTITEEE